MPLITVYDEDFNGSGTRPLALYNGNPIYQRMPLGTEGTEKFVTAAGSFWPDGNHTAPGPTGWLNLMCVMYSAIGNDPLGVPGVIPAGLDLRGGEITFRCRAKGGSGYPNGFYLPQKTRVGFWIQTWDDGACRGQGGYANWFQTRNLICSQMGVPRPGKRLANGVIQDAAIQQGVGWVDCVIPLSTDDGDWLPMGANPSKVDTYGNTSISQVLKTWNHDFGIIAVAGEPLPVPPTYTYPLGFGGGQFQVARITLKVDQDLNPGF